MARPKAGSSLVAVESGEESSCNFCHSKVHDEAMFGKMYSLGSVNCHYFCVLLSSCLVQNGDESLGIFGFLEADILKEIERGKKNKCVFCNQRGATLACCLTQCKRQFHLPCGKEKGVVSLFYGSYPSFCIKHGPKQDIAPEVMAKAKLRMQATNSRAVTKRNSEELLDEEQICSICYEEVEAFPTPNTFWPPCCARDRWLHSKCVQLMALNAGAHYLKCPLCNDVRKFQSSLKHHGYYIPDRDASWELERNAFSEIYERPKECSAEICFCVEGRRHDACEGDYDLRICCVCGSKAVHAICQAESARWFVCEKCVEHAPEDLEKINSIQLPSQQEDHPESIVQERIIMPARLSIARTKPNYVEKPSVPLRKQTIQLESQSPQEAPLLGFHQLSNEEIKKKSIGGVWDVVTQAFAENSTKPGPKSEKLMRLRKRILDKYEDEMNEEKLEISSGHVQVNNANTSLNCTESNGEQQNLITSESIIDEDHSIDTSKSIINDEHSIDTSESIINDEHSIDTSESIINDEHSIDTSESIINDEHSIDTSEKIINDEHSIDTSESIMNDDHSIDTSKSIINDDHSMDTSESAVKEDIDINKSIIKEDSIDTTKSVVNKDFDKTSMISEYRGIDSTKSTANEDIDESIIKADYDASESKVDKEIDKTAIKRNYSIDTIKSVINEYHGIETTKSTVNGDIDKPIIKADCSIDTTKSKVNKNIDIDKTTLNRDYSIDAIKSIINEFRGIDTKLTVNKDIDKPIITTNHSIKTYKSKVNKDIDKTTINRDYSIDTIKSIINEYRGIDTTKVTVNKDIDKSIIKADFGIDTRKSKAYKYIDKTTIKRRKIEYRGNDSTKSANNEDIDKSIIKADYPIDIKKSKVYKDIGIDRTINEDYSIDTIKSIICEFRGFDTSKSTVKEKIDKSIIQAGYSVDTVKSNVFKDINIDKATINRDYSIDTIKSIINDYHRFDITKPITNGVDKINIDKSIIDEDHSDDKSIINEDSSIEIDHDQELSTSESTISEDQLFSHTTIEDTSKNNSKTKKKSFKLKIRMKNPPKNLRKRKIIWENNNQKQKIPKINSNESKNDRDAIKPDTTVSKRDKTASKHRHKPSNNVIKSSDINRNIKTKPLISEKIRENIRQLKKQKREGTNVESDSCQIRQMKQSVFYFKRNRFILVSPEDELVKNKKKRNHKKIVSDSLKQTNIMSYFQNNSSC